MPLTRNALRAIPFAVTIAVVAFRLMGLGFRPVLGLELVYVFGLANVALAVFNMIPLPPLDGSAVVERVLPKQWWPGYLRLRQYSMLILLAIFLMAPRVLGYVMDPAFEVYYDVLGLT